MELHLAKPQGTSNTCDLNVGVPIADNLVSVVKPAGEHMFSPQPRRLNSRINQINTSATALEANQKPNKPSPRSEEDKASPIPQLLFISKTRPPKRPLKLGRLAQAADLEATSLKRHLEAGEVIANRIARAARPARAMLCSFGFRPERGETAFPLSSLFTILNAVVGSHRDPKQTEQSHFKN